MTTTTPTTGTSISDILAQQAAAASAATGSTSSTSSTDSTDSTNSNPANALQDLSGDYQNFLSLLTTQLQNQDPLDPMDTSQFTQQLVEFSSVEQQINTNSKLDQMISLQSTANAYGAVGFVGTTVSANSDQLPLQNGKAQFDYQIPTTGTAATLKIMDSSGNVVMLEQVDATAGTHPVQWDGTDYFGNQLSDGQYSVSVDYTDQSGNSNDATITTYGTVTSAAISDGTVSLKLGDVTIPLSDVTSISHDDGTSSTTAPASTSSDSSSTSTTGS
jgi:flagellar basal-body rod modification protein FlgD